MTSQSGKQTIGTHTKYTITIQLIEYSVRNTFLQNHAEKKAGVLVPDLFLIFKKTL